MKASTEENSSKKRYTENIWIKIEFELKMILGRTGHSYWWLFFPFDSCLLCCPHLTLGQPCLVWSLL